MKLAGRMENHFTFQVHQILIVLLVFYWNEQHWSDESRDSRQVDYFLQANIKMFIDNHVQQNRCSVMVHSSSTDLAFSIRGCFLLSVFKNCFHFLVERF